MHISLDGFVACPNGEMNWIKVDEEIFDHVDKRISRGNTASCPHNTLNYFSCNGPYNLLIMTIKFKINRTKKVASALAGFGFVPEYQVEAILGIQTLQ